MGVPSLLRLTPCLTPLFLVPVLALGSALPAAAEGPDHHFESACDHVNGPLAYARDPESVMRCYSGEDRALVAWAARAATKVGRHKAAAAFWGRISEDAVLGPLARLAEVSSRIDLGEFDRARKALPKAPGGPARDFLSLRLDTLDGQAKDLGKRADRLLSKATHASDLAIVNAACLKSGGSNCAAARRLRVDWPGTPEEKALTGEFPFGLDAPALAQRWKRAQLLGDGERAGAECSAWVATLPAETTPALDDAVAACGRLTSLLRLPVAMSVLTRATTKPATANAAWLGIARIHARSNDLEAIDEACTHVAPGSIEQAECFTLTTVLRLRAGHVDIARARLNELDTRFPKSPKRREAWHQFVAQRWDDPEVPKILEGLLQSATDPVAKAEAAYWLGRKATDPGKARQYWEISRTTDPLGYFGTLANARLGGPTATALTPVRTEPFDKTLALLRRAGFYEEAERRVAKGRNTKQVVNQADTIGEGGAWETIVRAGILGGGETRWPASPLTRIAFPLAFPDELADVPDARRPLLLSLMRRESLFDPGAISFVGARGLLQLMPKTATRLSTDAALPVPTPEELHLPALNVDLADRYVALLLQRFQHPLVAAAAYNAGPPAVLKWIAESKGAELDLFVERIPYRETRIYVRAVAAALAGYTRLETGEFPAYSLDLPMPAATGVDY